jgi:hypothetical protein
VSRLLKGSGRNCLLGPGKRKDHIWFWNSQNIAIDDNLLTGFFILLIYHGLGWHTYKYILTVQKHCQMYLYFLPEPVFSSSFWTALPPVWYCPLWTPVLWAQFELPYTLETNNISIIIDIEEVLRINDKDYSITFSTYFNVEWKEKEPKIVMMTFSVCFFLSRSAERVMRSDCGRKIFLIKPINVHTVVFDRVNSIIFSALPFNIN